MRRLLLIPAIVALVLAFEMGHVSAHALLVRSQPSQDAVVPLQPPVIHLWFSEDLNTSLSRAIVWNAQRQRVDQGNDTVTANRELTVSLKPHLAKGTYLVLWTSVSAQDGHVLKGAYLFSIGRRGPAPASPNLGGGSGGPAFPPNTEQLFGLAARALELMASALWLGLTLCLVFVFPSPSLTGSTATLAAAASRPATRLLPVGLVILFLARAATLILQANSLAGSWSSTFIATNFRGLLLQTEYGHLWIIMQAVVAASLVISLLAALGPARSPSLSPKQDSVAAGGDIRLLSMVLPFPKLAVQPVSTAALLLFAAVVDAYLLVASGHAATVNLSHTGTGIITAPVAIDWLHVLASGVWVGGMFAIVLALVPAFKQLGTSRLAALLDTLDRFSPFAYASVAALALTGSFNGKVHVPSWAAFFDSIYGKTLIVKMSLVLVMILISAFTVRYVRPRCRKLLASGVKEGDGATMLAFLEAVLIRWLRIGAFLGILVFCATAVLNAYPVPTTFGAASGPFTMTQHRGLYSISLGLTPGHAGQNTFTVRLKNAGKPVPLAQVRVLETMLDMPMGTQYILLFQKAPGVFTGQGDVSMGGHWQLEVVAVVPNSTSVITATFRPTVS